MRDLVRHHTCELRFIVGRLNGSYIHVQRTTRESERVDFLLVHHMKLIWPFLSRSVLHQSAPELLNVLRDWIGVGQYGILAVGLRRCLLSRLDLLLEGEHVGAARRLNAGIQQFRRGQKHA